MKDSEDIKKLVEALESNDLSINHLSEEQLYAVVEYETSVMGEDNAPSPLLEQCLSALDKFHDYDDAISTEKLTQMAKCALDDEERRPISARKPVSKRTWIYRIAAIAAAFCVLFVCAAVIYRQNQDIIVPSEEVPEISTDYIPLDTGIKISDDGTVLYATIEDAKYHLNVNLITLDASGKYKLYSIVSHERGIGRVLELKYKNGDDKVYMYIYLDKSPLRGKSYFASSVPKSKINNMIFYLFRNEWYNHDRAVLFYDDYVYSIYSTSTDSYNVLVDFIKSELSE